MKKFIKKTMVGLVAASMLASFAPVVTMPVSAATVTKGSYDFSHMTIRRVWFNTSDPVFLIDDYQRVWLDKNVNVLATGNQADVAASSDLMAPMKEMFAHIGAEYTESDNDVTIKMNGTTLKFKVGSDDVEINDKVSSNALSGSQIPKKVNAKTDYAEYNTYLTEEYNVIYLPVAYVMSIFQADVYKDSNMGCFYAAIPVFNTESVPSFETSSEGYGNRYDTLLDGTMAVSTEVADNLVAIQNEDGGFQLLPDNTEMTQTDLASKLGSMKANSTLENGATTTALKYLASYVTEKQPTDSKYQDAFTKGIDFLVKNQKEDGSWAMQPTDAAGFNGNAVVGNKCMTEVLNLLSDVALLNNQNYVFARRNADLTTLKTAVTKGTDYLVKTQVTNDGVKAGWATQYNANAEVTMGRTYERESVSAFTTKDVVEYLLSVREPSDAVKAAIDGAVKWLGDVKIADKEQSVVKDVSMNNGFDVYFVDGNGTWANQYVYNAESKKYRPLYSDVDPTRPDQPYVNIYEINELSRNKTTADSTDLILYGTRTTVKFYDNTLANDLIATDYVVWQGYVSNGFPELPVDPAVSVEPGNTNQGNTESDATGETLNTESNGSNEQAATKVQTGDRAPIKAMVILFAGSAAVAGLCVYKKKRNAKIENK